MKKTILLSMIMMFLLSTIIFQASFAETTEKTFPVTFIAHMEKGMNATGDLYISVHKSNEDLPYEYVLHNYNKYVSDEELPAGDYEIVDGTMDDENNLTAFTQKTKFTVDNDDSGLTTFVEFNVGPSYEQSHDYSLSNEELSQNEDAETNTSDNQSPTPKTTTEKIKSISTVFIIIIAMVFIAAVVFITRIVIKRRK